MPRPPTRRTLGSLLAAVSVLGLAHGGGGAAAAAPATAVPTGGPRAEPAEPEALAVAVVRAGRHQGFDRLVVEWPGAVRPEMAREGGAVRLRFPHPGRLDLAGVAGQLGRHILAVEAGQEDGTAVLVVRLRPGTEPRLSAPDRRRVVLDALPTAGAATAGAAAPGGPQAGRAGGVVPAATPAKPVRHPAARPAAPSPGGDERVVALLREELYRRDLMIASLLQRVERLERGVPLPDRSSEERALDERPLDEVIAGGVPALAGPAPAAGRVVVAQAGPPAVAGPEAGPAAAPAGAAKPEERALERVLARDGTLLLRPGEAELEPELSFTRRENDAPVFVTDGGTSFFIGEDEVRRKEYAGSLALRVGLPLDSQLELALPYRYVDQSTVTELGFGEARSLDADGHGPGDLVLAAAKALTRQRGWRPDLVARAWWDTRSGETRDGGVPLGGGFDELGLAVSALRRQDPLAFFAALSYETTLERDRIDPGDEVGLRLGAALAVSPETSLRFSIDQRFAGEAEVRGEEVGGSDRSAATLSLDAASVLGRGVLLDVGFDIGLTDDAPDYTARVSLPIRFDLPVF